MLLHGQDPHEMHDPLHQCPAVVAAVHEERYGESLDSRLEDALLNRFLDMRKLARAA